MCLYLKLSKQTKKQRKKKNNKLPKTEITHMLYEDEDTVIVASSSWLNLNISITTYLNWIKLGIFCFSYGFIPLFGKSNLIKF